MKAKKSHNYASPEQPTAGSEPNLVFKVSFFATFQDPHGLLLFRSSVQCPKSVATFAKPGIWHLQNMQGNPSFYQTHLPPKLFCFPPLVRRWHSLCAEKQELLIQLAAMAQPQWNSLWHPTVSWCPQILGMVSTASSCVGFLLLCLSFHYCFRFIKTCVNVVLQEESLEEFTPTLPNV